MLLSLFSLTPGTARLGFRGAGLSTGGCLPHCRGQGAELAPTARFPMVLGLSPLSRSLDLLVHLRQKDEPSLRTRAAPGCLALLCLRFCYDSCEFHYIKIHPE